MGNLCATGEEEAAVTGSAPGMPPRSDSDRHGFRSGLVRKKAGNDIWNHYEQGDQIGKGMTGGVWVITHKKTGAQYAMKSIILNRMKRELLEDLRNEIELLKQCDHPNIIKLYEYYEDEYRIYLVLELCTGGELYERLADQSTRHYGEKEAARLVSKMLSAICYCHRKNISHRDLKLENFIFENEEADSNIKLIDFGLSRKYGSLMRMNTMVGTPYYIAPEILRGHGYTQAVDMWSMGVITYMLLSGKPPFAAREDSAILAKVRKGKYNFSGETWKAVSADAHDFVQRLLEANPKKRMNAESALQHRWLRRNDDYAAHKPPSGRLLDPGIVHSLRDFSRMSVIKRAALEAIAFSMNAREIVDMRRAFQTIDKDKSGQLTLSEVQEALIMEGMSAEEVRKVFDGVNQDAQRTISYSEFLAATLSRRLYMQEERIQEAFHRLDVSNTGYITKEDLRAVLGDDYDPVRVDEMMSAADDSGDGKIDYGEFVKMIRDERALMVDAVKPAPSASRAELDSDSDGRISEHTEEDDDDTDSYAHDGGAGGAAGGAGGAGGPHAGGSDEEKLDVSVPTELLASTDSPAKSSARASDAPGGAAEPAPADAAEPAVDGDAGGEAKGEVDGDASGAAADAKAGDADADGDDSPAK